MTHSLRMAERALVVRPLWLVYAWVAKAWWVLRRGFSARTVVFAQKGYLEGLIPREKNEALLRLLEKTALKPVTQDDTASGYVFNEKSGDYAKDLEKDRFVYELKKEHLDLVRSVLEEASDTLERALGFSWRVVNVNFWRTAAGAPEKGFAVWHTDHFASGVMKLFVYVTGAGERIGTTQVRMPDGSTVLIEGPPGTWLLFDVSRRTHRGLTPLEGARILLQVTLVPAFRTDPTPVTAGSNANYPKIPWVS